MTRQSGEIPRSSHSEDDKQVLRVVLIGKSGSGKSSTGNTILGTESFKTDFAASSVTKNCHEKAYVRSGQKIMIIDTPGVFDTERQQKEVLTEISKCISLSLPGPHVFLLVVRAGRFTPEENDTVKHFAELFGEEAFKYVILVFTGRDELEKRKQSFKEFLKKIPPSLAEILKKCNNRCIAIDNSPDKQSRAIDAEDLMKQIKDLVKEHDGKWYTNEMFEAAEKKCREREKQIKLEMDLKKKKEKDALEEKLNKEFEQKLAQLKPDDTNQRQLLLQIQKEAILQQSTNMDNFYRRETEIRIARSNSEATFMLMRGIGEAALGLLSLICSTE